MNFLSFDEVQDDFFSNLDQNLPDLDYFSGSKDQSEAPFLQNPNSHESTSPELNLFSSIYPSDSQRSERMPDSLGDYSSQSEHKESYYSLSSGAVSENQPDPMSRSSHKITKSDSENTKRKPKITAADVLAGEIPLKYVPEEFNEEGLDEKEKKKILQMIRNRVAAQNSRDRKKNHIKQMEEQNKAMCQEVAKLKKYIKQLEGINAALQKENHDVKLALMNSYYYYNAQRQSVSNEPPRSNFVSQECVRNDPLESTVSGNGPSSESSQQSISGVPVMRRGFSSGSFMKYSIALVTIFAVVMFTGLNPPSQAVYNSMLQRTALPNQRIYNNKGRFLQQEEYCQDYFILDPRYKDWNEDPSYLFERSEVYESLIPKAFQFFKNHWNNLTDSSFFNEISHSDQKPSIGFCPNRLVFTNIQEVCSAYNEVNLTHQTRWKELKLRDPELVQVKTQKVSLQPNIVSEYDSVSFAHTQTEDIYESTIDELWSKAIKFLSAVVHT